MSCVFTYWDAMAGQARPPHIDLCIETILRHCSADFDVHILDRASVSDYLDPADLPAESADPKHSALRTALVRAALLVRHGGVWMDPDLILLRSPAGIVQRAEEYGLAACERRPGVPLTCLIASTPRNHIMLNHHRYLEKKMAGTGRRWLGWLGVFRRWGTEFDSLGRVPPENRYFGYPAAAFAPVARRDAHKFLDRELPLESVICESTTAVSLSGILAAPRAPEIGRDELLNADFVVSRLFRRALDIEEGQRHKAYQQVSVHRERSGSWSGPGSTVTAAREAIEFLPRIVKKYGIKSIGDMPCGDWTWMQEVDLSPVDYTGYDIVEFLIQENRRKHPGVKFEVKDILKGHIGKFDLIICRDFLFHVTAGDAVRVLAGFRESGSKYLLTTTFDDLEANVDLPEGAEYGYREINLELPPYNLGKPLEYVRETHVECHNRVLGLWRLTQAAPAR